MKSFLVLVAMAMLCASAVAQAYTFDSDVPQDLRDQVTQDLAFINSIQGSDSSALHTQIFGAVSGTGYQQWLENRVKGVGLSDCGDPKAVACVIPYQGSSHIWLTPNYTHFSHPQVARMMVVYHEARHTEVANGNWPHAACPTPFLSKDGQEIKSIWTGSSLAGEPACDTTEFGSYGSSMIMMKNIQKFCSNCTAKVKMDAGLYADDQFMRLIDDQAIANVKQDLYNN